MSLDNDELQLYLSNNAKEETETQQNAEEDRFTRKSSSLAFKRLGKSVRLNSAKPLKQATFQPKKRTIKA